MMCSGKRPVELTGANQNTLKVRLRELVNAGRLQRYGKGRATWYQICGSINTLLTIIQ